MSETRLPQDVRETVAQRAGGCCEYCCSQASFSPSDFTVDHIIPRVNGGLNDLDNLAYACGGCNNRKFTHTTARDPAKGRKSPLFNPRTHIWKEHFSWQKSFTQLVGLTPIG